MKEIEELTKIISESKYNLSPLTHKIHEAIIAIDERVGKLAVELETNRTKSVEVVRPDPPHFEGYEWTGERRPPKKGEYYLGKEYCNGKIEFAYISFTSWEARYIYRKVDPPLDLNAKVAKALGADNIVKAGDKWMLDEGSVYIDISCYSTSPELAIAALEEYCDKHDNLRAQTRLDDNGWQVFLTDYWHEMVSAKAVKGKTLSLAICQAIVSHAERMK